MKRKGFTIIELMLVIGIIAILIGIVSTAASESLRVARTRRAQAAITVVQTGLAAYHAAKDEWPIDLKSKTANHKAYDTGSFDSNIYDLSATEVRQCVYALAAQAKNGNPIIDVTGLWVSRHDGNSTREKVPGMDFMSAIRGTRESSRKMKLDEMYFGYPRKSDGGFERFGMGYSMAADTISVGYLTDYPVGCRR